MSKNTSSAAEREAKLQGYYSKDNARATVANDIDYLLNYSSVGTSFSVENRMLIPPMISFPGDVADSVNTPGHAFGTFFPNCSKSSLATNHVCRVCAKTFRASSLLDIHMRVHVGAKPFVCPICGHRATQKGNLKLHMKKHHGADLPPHIDLVPDSGIWGHPQENILCSTSPQMPDFIDNSDASGKRKQVAQAVSSLLNEEVVELIKKYQNNVGQGTTGTITESLEDFIRVAKNKAGSPSKMAAENVKSKTEDERRKKKRMAISFRFKPYSEEARNSNHFHPMMYNNSSQKVNVSEERTRCLLCGKSVVARQKFFKSAFTNNIPYSQICEECYDFHQTKDFGTGRCLPDGDLDKSKKYGDTTASINGVVSKDANRKDDTRCPATCNVCGNIFINLSQHKKHKEQCHSIKPKTQFLADKENFVTYLGLKSVQLSHDVTKKTVTHTNGLNPVISHMTWYLSKGQSKTQKEIYHRLELAPSEMKPKISSDKDDRRPDKVTARSESRSVKHKRASLSVLNMLRQALLNSADQKASLGLKNAKTNSSESSYSREGSPTELLENSKPPISPYRNPAMQSLAEIGKSLALPESAYEKASATKRPFLDENVTHDAQEQDRNGYRCQFCQKWFKYRSVLEIHMRSHTGERPYKCPYCEYAGTQHNCLKLHIQRHHPMKYASNYMETPKLCGPVVSQSLKTDSTANKVSCFSPVHCPVCGRMSPSPGYLKIHMRSHKKSLDHVCHVCGRGFKEYWYLTTHLKTHERELSSLKLNLQRRNMPYPPSNVPAVLPSGHSNSKLRFLSRLAQANSSKDLVSVRTRCDESESQLQFLKSDRRVCNSALNINHAWQNANTELSVNQDSSSESNSSHERRIQDSGAHLYPRADVTSSDGAVSRSRRRKASCPSRVVSAPYMVPRSSPRHDHSASQCSSYMRNFLSDTATQKVECTNEADDLPLDLRCPAKKMSDQNNKTCDSPMNLCKT